jgi:ParB-like chromosome segregation protein Spo0J
MSLKILPSQDVAIADVRPYTSQLRQHNRHQRRKLAKLLKTFGQIVPIVIDKSNTVLDGHLVREVLLEMGHKTIKVVRIEGLTDPEYRSLRLALNRLAQDAAWDNEILKAESNPSAPCMLARRSADALDLLFHV